MGVLRKRPPQLFPSSHGIGDWGEEDKREVRVCQAFLDKDAPRGNGGWEEMAMSASLIFGHGREGRRVLQVVVADNARRE